MVVVLLVVVDDLVLEVGVAVDLEDSVVAVLLLLLCGDLFDVVSRVAVDFSLSLDVDESRSLVGDNS